MRKLVTAMAVTLTPGLVSAQTSERQTTPATAQPDSGQPTGSTYGPPAPSPKPTGLPAAANSKGTTASSDPTATSKHHGRRRGAYVGAQGGGVL